MQRLRVRQREGGVAISFATNATGIDPKESNSS